jgi:hypothetical protein
MQYAAASRRPAATADPQSRNANAARSWNVDDGEELTVGHLEEWTMRTSFAIAMAASLLAGSAFAQYTSPSNPPADIQAPKTETAPAAKIETAPAAPAAAPRSDAQHGQVAPAAEGPQNPAVRTEEGNNAKANRPVAGANSFTEGEAKSRIEARGFANVGELKKDDQGIWRGKAEQNGRMVDVALDYQGNVFADPS